MDDIKLFSLTKYGLRKPLDGVWRYRTDIEMKMGLDKCKINNMNMGKKWAKHEAFQVKVREYFCAS